MAALNPTLTVRSLAELLRQSAPKQSRILHEQKYPKEGTQIFRTPYYLIPLAGIRDFYRTDNDRAALRRARSKIQSISNTARRANNDRVLDRFEGNSTQFNRKLALDSNKRFAADFSTIHVKLSTDLQAIEGKRQRFFYYNCKNTALSARVAEDALAIGHWVLQQNDIDVPVDALEYIDLFTGKVYRLRESRPATVKALMESARTIENLWPTV